MSFKETEIGIIPQSWKLMSLGEVAEVIDPHPSHRAPAAVKTGLPFAGIGDIDEYGNINSEKARIVSEDVIEEHLKNYKVDNNSIGYGRVGTVGKVVKLKERSTLKYALSPTLAVINSNELIDKKFLYALLRSNLFFNQVKKYMTGSTRPSIGIKVLRDIKIPYPDINEQQYIGRIVSSLDEKIEVNNQINKTLENMAQTIFKQWFVDFEFPNEDGEPYKSSGGEMVESELGMIPKGWEVGTLNDISLDIITGKTPSTKDKNNFNGDIPFVKIPDMHDKVFVTKTESYLSDKGAVKNKIIPPNSIIVSCIATPGLVSLASEECQTNQQINTIINKYEKMYYYTYFLLTSLSEHIRTLGSTGSTTLNLNKGQFSKIKVLIPLRKVTKNYHDLVDPLFKEILTNAALDEELTQIRDSLLPKLMSGEIRVPMDEEGDLS